MSSNSSTGQILGYVVGAVVSYFTFGAGYVALGAAVGGVVGGAIDPPKGPTIVGPRLSDLSQQGASYGTPIPRIYGSAAMFGNIFWIENNALKETSQTSGGGKGGGGGAETTTYRYSATFALGLCEGPIAGVRRVWIGGKLMFDAGSDDLGTIIASNRFASAVSIYLGSEDQAPNPRMQAALGTENTPAYRGLAYLVFEDLDLSDFGNTLLGAQIKVEVVALGDNSYKTANISVPYSQPADNVTYHAKPFYLDTESVLFLSPQLSPAGSSGAGSSYKLHQVFFDGSAVETGIAVEISRPIPSYRTDDSSCLLLDASTIFSGGLFDTGRGHIVQSGGIYVGISNYDVNLEAVRTIYISFGIPISTRTLLANADDHSVCTDGEFLWVAGATSIRQYDLNFNLQASGPGIGGNVALANLILAEGNLYFCENENPSDVVAISSDLATHTVIASGLSPLQGFYSSEFTIANNLVLFAAGTQSPKALAVRYYNIAALNSEGDSLASIVAAECLRSSVLQSSDLDVSSLIDTVRGYRISSVAALRSALEPLQGAWPFDVMQSGYKIKFIRRGTHPSLATVGENDLDARKFGEKSGVRLTQSREMSTQLPWRVSATYLDINREYDVGSQYSERLNTASVNERSLEMPIVLNGSEAAGIVEALLYLYWLERCDVQFALPPRYRWIEPGDVLTVTAGGRSLTVRLVEIGYDISGVLSVSGKLHDNAVYTSSAIGAEGNAASDVIAVMGPSVTRLLDMPTLKDAFDTPGIVVAMSGYLQSWQGGTVYKSDDDGQVWQSMSSFARPSRIGYAINRIAAPADHRLIDAASVLSVHIFQGELSSINELQMLNGANHFAYGVDGRWEIIAARSIALQPDGSYRLSDLLRGRFGSEWACGMHQINDALIFIDMASLQFAHLSTNQIGLAKIYRGISKGASIDSVNSQSFTYRGVNFECLAPVLLSGHRDASGDWSISWVRRTRVGGEWRDYVDALLGEGSEAYEIDIFEDISYALVKRTLSIGAANAIYTLVQQAADFGAGRNELFVQVYQKSALVGRGYPLRGRLSVLTTGSSSYPAGALSFLSHFNGTNESTSVIDEAGGAVALSGAASLSTTRSKFGGSSLSIANAADYASVLGGARFDVTATESFSFEFFLYRTSESTAGEVFDFGPAHLRMYINNNGSVVLRRAGVVLAIGPAVIHSDPRGSITAGSWHHVAIVQDIPNGYLYLIVDGHVLMRSLVPAALTSASTAYIAGSPTPAGNLAGNVDEMRFLKNIVAYSYTGGSPYYDRIAVPFEEFGI